jgi:hypothetical protein
MKLTYLIQPYTSSPHSAYEFALALLAREALYNSAHSIFSPIVHYHESADRYSLPIEFRFWLPHNLDFITAASEVRVVCARGLHTSIGCIVEEEFARRLQKPIYYYALDSVIQGPAESPYRSLCTFGCVQQTTSYEVLLKEIQTELRVKRAREDSPQLA